MAGAAEGLIKQWMPVIIIEIWNDEMREKRGLGTSRGEIIQMLEGWGYELRLIGSWDYVCLPPLR